MWFPPSSIILDWQVGNLWCFYQLRFPMKLHQERPTWSSANKWLWRGDRRDSVAGSRAWPRRFGSRCASASLSVGISSETNAGTAAWMVGEVFWKEVSHFNTFLNFGFLLKVTEKVGNSLLSNYKLYMSSSLFTCSAWLSSKNRMFYG